MDALKVPFRWTDVAQRSSGEVNLLLFFPWYVLRRLPGGLCLRSVCFPPPLSPSPFENHPPDSTTSYGRNRYWYKADTNRTREIRRQREHNHARWFVTAWSYEWCEGEEREDSNHSANITKRANLAVFWRGPELQPRVCVCKVRGGEWTPCVRNVQYMAVRLETVPLWIS